MTNINETLYTDKLVPEDLHTRKLSELITAMIFLHSLKLGSGIPMSIQIRNLGIVTDEIDRREPSRPPESP